MLPTRGLARPDFLLLFVPLALLAGLLMAILSPLTVAAGAGLGSLLASVAVIDGVGLNPPAQD